jgi:RNA polymerase sigma factor (TIGR02999 family)
MTDLTRLLDAAARGDPQAARELLPLVYDELRRLAAARLAHEPAGQTLGATALVHEAYLRVVGPDPDRPWDGRRHFFGAAAEAMRRILVDQARQRRSKKRGGDRGRIEIDLAGLALPEPDADLLALNDALDRLAERDPLKAELVKLLYFAGLTLPQAAQTLDLSPAAAKRAWAYARAWLRVEARDGAAAPKEGEKKI